MKPPDATLVSRTLAGDAEAYGDLVERYRNAAYGLAYHLLGDFGEAKDATQEALIRAFHRLADLRDPARFGPWLRQIVASTCAYCRRKLTRRQQTQLRSFGGDDVLADPHRALVANELKCSVSEMVGRLSESNRLAFIMYYIDGLSHSEIGEFLGVSADAVKMRVHRARQQLRESAADLAADTLGKHSLPPPFTQEVGRMIAHFGVSGHGYCRSVFPDESSRQLYAYLYPHGDLTRAADLAGVPRSRALELAQRWQELSVVERRNGEWLCRAPVLIAPDVEELRPWWEAFREIAIAELERPLPDLREIAQDSAGLAPLGSALEAVVYWEGACAAPVGAARLEGLAPPPRGPVRADTGEYHLFGSAAGLGLPDEFGHSKSDYGDVEGWWLVVVTWFAAHGHAEMAGYMQAREFPVRDDPLLWRLVRPLRNLHDHPPTRDELVDHIREREITEYPPDGLVDALVRFRFITEDEPHRLLIPVVDERIGSPLHGLLCEMRAAIGPRLRAVDPLRQEAVRRCSFKDCLPSDVAHLCFLKASAWLTPTVFDRGLVPPLPEAAYADRGVFLLRYPGQSP
jgi:RNA polymerase sigma-70 factor (ECF subfamily)